MKRTKRLLLAMIGTLAGVTLAVALFLLSSAVVFAGTGADPSDAFRAPQLANSSLSAALTWDENSGSAQLGTVEMERLGMAWADGFALVERRSNGEDIDLTRRFDETLAQHLAAPEGTTWSPFVVLHHSITLDLISTNRQVVALTVQVDLEHIVGSSRVRSVDTYKATLANGSRGWTMLTFNRTGTSTQP